ncbi:MAG: signal peptidase I [Candidatus Yonathbacteria bacterium]|nr:signal peptidase I [Candidatus Yonathbacteria bacterium]
MDNENNPSPSRLETIPRHSFFKEVVETVRFIFIALIIVIPIRFFIAQPFIVSGASMDPTFTDGQYLIVDEISYRFNEPARGDVVIFKYPKDPQKYFIKRIIGLPGEKVVINEHGNVFIHQVGSEGTVALKEPYIHFPKNESAERELGADEYFVMGQL